MRYVTDLSVFLTDVLAAALVVSVAVSLVKPFLRLAIKDTSPLQNAVVRLVAILCGILLYGGVSLATGRHWGANLAMLCIINGAIIGLTAIGAYHLLTTDGPLGNGSVQGAPITSSAITLEPARIDPFYTAGLYAPARSRSNDLGAGTQGAQNTSATFTATTPYADSSAPLTPPQPLEAMQAQTTQATASIPASARVEQVGAEAVQRLRQASTDAASTTVRARKTATVPPTSADDGSVTDEAGSFPHRPMAE